MIGCLPFHDLSRYFWETSDQSEWRDIVFTGDIITRISNSTGRCPPFHDPPPLKDDWPYAGSIVVMVKNENALSDQKRNPPFFLLSFEMLSSRSDRAREHGHWRETDQSFPSLRCSLIRKWRECENLFRTRCLLLVFVGALVRLCLVSNVLHKLCKKKAILTILMHVNSGSSSRNRHSKILFAPDHDQKTHAQWKDEFWYHKTIN